MNRLASSLDGAFERINAAFISGQPSADETRAFVEAAHAHLSQDAVDEYDHSPFFCGFESTWRCLRDRGAHGHAQELWRFASSVALDWEAKNPGRRIHKGTPYYFWAMTALDQGDIDLAFALMHAAHSEDVNLHRRKDPPEPALKFATLDKTSKDQAALVWVERIAEQVERALGAYRDATASDLTYQKFTDRFLRNVAVQDTVFVFSHAVARIAKLEELDAGILGSTFGKQLQLEVGLNASRSWCKFACISFDLAPSLRERRSNLRS